MALRLMNRAPSGIATSNRHASDRGLTSTPLFIAAPLPWGSPAAAGRKRQQQIARLNFE